MVITAMVIFGELALRIDGTAKFTTEDDEGIFEHPSLIKIFEQSGSRLVDVLALLTDLRWQSTMLIPATVEKLNIPNTFFSHSTSQKAIPRKAPRLISLRTVKLLHVIRFTFNIHEPGHFGLHAKG